MKTLSLVFILIFFLAACSRVKDREVDKNPRNIEFIYSDVGTEPGEFHYYGERYFEE